VTEAHGEVTVDELTLADEFTGADAAAPASADVAEYALWLGDDALILAQQLAGWIARAPELEEDVALGNIALDLLGHARSLLRYAGTADGRSEDDLAFFRDEPDFHSAWIVEQPNGDFAQTIACVAIVPLPIQRFAPLSTQSSPSFVATVRRP
jgi:ring-1,2-phenylacetyl-CoA epoxidase subunit PaaC